MSDFDKEAERQKLREKFDRDREKRKETERMSQLLLQGATMTNRHCDTCGDPLFRYQGQVFCATCEGRAQEADEQTQTQAEADTKPATAGEAAATGDAEGTDAAESTTSGRTDTNVTGYPTAQGEGEYRGDDAEAATGASERTSATADANTNSTATATNTLEPRTEPGRASPSSAGSRDGDDALADARASLVRTLTYHAQQAETADGPRRATEHLSAAREAAEALAALERGR